jgi:Uma2 family endonuclease
LREIVFNANVNHQLGIGFMEALTINFSEVIELTDEQLFRLCSANKEIRIERTKEGELVIRLPTGGETGSKSLDLASEVRNWNKRTKLGKAFDSSTGFILPNKAMRSPDVAWVAIERWNNLSREHREQFPPLCPDFVIELMSKTDRLDLAQEKMHEWMDNGCRLAWLIDPTQEGVYIYRANGNNSIFNSFDEMLSGEDVLPGFVFNLAELR